MAFLQDTKPDIMTLNETFLRTPDQVFFPGYQPMARADRPNRHGGGVAILVRTGINFDVVNPIPTSGATSNEQLPSFLASLSTPPYPSPNISTLSPTLLVAVFSNSCLYLPPSMGHHQPPPSDCLTSTSVLY